MCTFEKCILFAVGMMLAGVASSMIFLDPEVRTMYGLLSLGLFFPSIPITYGVVKATGAIVRHWNKSLDLGMSPEQIKRYINFRLTQLDNDGVFDYCTSMYNNNLISLSELASYLLVGNSYNVAKMFDNREDTWELIRPAIRKVCGYRDDSGAVLFCNRVGWIVAFQHHISVST